MSISARDLVARSWSRPQVVGHRGAAASEAENTLAAFEFSIACGAPATECDVRLSRDGKIVVVHDADLQRTTRREGLVRETDSECLRGIGVPTLGDVLDVTANRTVLAVEIKAGDGIEARVADLLNERGQADQAFVFGFDSRRVASVVQARPGLFGVWLVGRPLEPWNFAELFGRIEQIGASGFGIGYESVTPLLVEAAQSRGIPIFSWTVPPGPEVERLRRLGVNFIITDDPAKVLTALS